MNKKLFRVYLGMCVVAFTVSFVFSASPWDPTKEYTTAFADTVTYGKFLGNDMYFTNQWYIGAADLDTPGTVMDSGGTSGWVFLNAVDPSIPYVWKGVEVSPGTEVQANIPTFRDGAKGGYVIHHDDLCAMDWKYVQPTMDFAREYGIPLAWGVKGDECDQEEYDSMLVMLGLGIEITCHSWNHHSASEQWQWFFHGDTLPSVEEDESVPPEVAEYIVDSTLTGGTTVTTAAPLNQTFTVNTTTKHIKTNSKAWSDDANANVSMVKLFCYPAWTAADYKLNVDDAKQDLDDKVYSKFNGNKWFPADKQCEFYIYPYDAFSIATHAYLDEHGFISARGGSKSGIPLRGDFYHPYFIDFDAYYLVNNDPNIVFPNNPHQKLSLEGMVDKIIETHGYMIRELHAVGPADEYWGAVPNDFYEAHFQRLQSLIETNDICVYTPSEGVKYRITENSVTGVTIESLGNKEYLLTVSATGCQDKYQDEISAIVAFPTSEDDWDQIAVTYNSSNDTPRFPPRKLSARVWSVSVNPYVGPVKIVGDMTSIDISKFIVNKLPKVKIVSFINGKLNMSLRQGRYTATLLAPNGKIVSRAIGLSSGGNIKVNMDIANLSNGFYLLNVRHEHGQLQKRVVIVQ